MSKKPPEPPPVDDLRTRAEKMLADLGPKFGNLPLDDVRQLVHELQVHMIELEMQNNELRRTNEDLDELRFKYVDLYDFAPVGYFSLDHKGQIVEVNLTGARLMGQERRRLLITPFSGLVAPADRMVCNHHLKEIFQRGGKQTCEVRLDPPEGTPFHASLDILAVRDEQGNITQCRMVVIDITRRKQAEEALAHNLAALRKSMHKTVSALATMAEIRYSHTAIHQGRVAQLSCAIADDMGFSPDRVEGLRVMGLLHDIGTIAVPTEILSKLNGKTSADEEGIKKYHPQIGYEILRELDFPWPVAQAVLQHHERLDGSGFPLGLEEPEIILEAKIIGVADVVETMACDLPNRPALGLDRALAEITRYKGVRYDSEVVNICVKLFTKKGFKFDLYPAR